MESLQQKLKSVKMIKTAVAVIAILHIIEFYGADATIKIQHKKLDFPNKELIYNPNSYVDGKLIYATCVTNSTSNEKQCQVIRQKAPYIDDGFSCNFSIKMNADAHKNHTGWKIFLKSFGEDKGIFYTIPEQSLSWNITFKTIHFRNCKLFDTEVHITRPYNPRYLMRGLDEIVTIVPFSDSYDVFYQNVTLNETHRLAINSEGKIIDGPIVYTKLSTFSAFLPFIVSISSQSRNEGYFYMDRPKDNDHYYHFIVLKPDGTTKLLGSHMAHYPMAKSATNNLIGVCYQAEMSKPMFKCTQYDANGKLKFETTMTSTMDKTRVSYSYNLPGGGFYVVFGTCTTKECKGEDIGLVAVKIDSSGQVVGSLEMKEVELQPGDSQRDVAISFYADGNDQHCISVVEIFGTRSHDKNNAHMNLSSHCFAEADLSKTSLILKYN